MISPTPTTLVVTPSSNSSMQTFEGQLNKFTNVVKGWQYRWFVLSGETGNLDYYLMDEGVIGKRRGRQHVAGTVVIPSEEDSQTFHVNFASGESYKLRAANVRDRQVWVDRIRAVAHRHESAMARDNAPPVIHKEFLGPPPGSKSLLASNGQPTQQLQHLSLSVLDAFGSVHDILQQTDLKHASLAQTIETLPNTASTAASKAKFPKCHDDELLVLKATSQAALHTMESALNILQDLRDLQVNHVTRHYRSASPLSLSPKKAKKEANQPLLENKKDQNETPNESACGSPTSRAAALSDPMGAAADTLSIKSAAVLDASCVTSGPPVITGSLSASTSNIDQAGHSAAGQKHS